MATADTLTRTTPTATRCTHERPCPAADAVDHLAARVISTQPGQGWSLLCNGVILFDDTGELLPDGSAIEPHRGPARHSAACSAPNTWCGRSATVRRSGRPFACATVM